MKSKNKKVEKKIWNPVTNRMVLENSSAGKVLLYCQKHGVNIDKPTSLPKLPKGDWLEVLKWAYKWLTDPYFNVVMMRKIGKGKFEYVVYEEANRGDAFWGHGIIDNFLKIDYSFNDIFKNLIYSSLDFRAESKNLFKSFLNINKLNKIQSKNYEKLVKESLQQDKNEKKIIEKYGFDSDKYEEWFWKDKKDYFKLEGIFLAESIGYKDIMDLLKNPLLD